MNKKNNDLLIGFIGQGWVGGSYADDFENRGYNVVRYALEEPYLQNGHKISDCDIVFIAVPTPSTPEGFDDSMVRSVMEKVGKGKTAVIKSTLAPGTTESIQQENPDIFVMHSPEFLREATAAEDAAAPERNIIGIPKENDTYYDKARIIMSILPYASFEKICDSKTAELIKYVGNVFLHHKVIFFNMVYDLCQKMGIDYDELSGAVAADPRIQGTHMKIFHDGGRGSAGHCFLKDKAAFMEMYKQMVGDEKGLQALWGPENKNFEFLKESGKDLDLLKSIYGEDFCKEEKETQDKGSNVAPINKPEKNTILVTGGAGFIGFHTAKKLLERGDRVVVVDNFNDYYDPQIKKDRIRELEQKYEDLVVYKVDISDYEAMERIFLDNKINKVCHLAAQAGVRYSLSKPFTYLNSNISSFLNLLELCRHHNIKDLIYASSSSVYGNNKKLPFSEDDRVDTPISLYAASKKSNEEMAFTYHHLFGLNCTGLRFFTVYGPWGRPDMALFNFTDSILKGEAIDVYNYGDMARDFTYIDDVISGVIAAIDKSYPYEVFNLARGESIKLLDFIKEIEENLGQTASKNMMEIQPGDVPATSADISKAREKLDYSPQVSVQEGVKNFVDWYKNYFQVN